MLWVRDLVGMRAGRPARILPNVLVREVAVLRGGMWEAYVLQMRCRCAAPWPLSSLRKYIFRYGSRVSYHRRLSVRCGELQQAIVFTHITETPAVGQKHEKHGKPILEIDPQNTPVYLGLLRTM